jgi:hypothetical protein
MKRKIGLLGGLACLLGLLIAVRDTVAIGDDAPMLTLVLLIVSAALLGFVRPGRAWQWALLIGVWPALVHLALHGLGLNDHFQPNTVLARLALLPLALTACLAGAYGGVVARHILLSTEGLRR